MDQLAKLWRKLKALRAALEQKAVLLLRGDQARAAGCFEDANGYAKFPQSKRAGQAGYSRADDDRMTRIHTSAALERLGEQRPLVHFLFAQVAIKRHGKIAYESPAPRCNADFVFGKKNQAVLAHGGKFTEFPGEIVVEMNVKFVFNFGFQNHSMA